MPLVPILVALSSAPALAAPTPAPIDCSAVDPYPSKLVDPSGLDASRYGKIRFQARDGNVLNAYTYRATTFSPKSGPILFVMHGTDRDADEYRDALAAVAERYGALAIAPEFPESLYPDSEDYTLGVGTGDTPYGGTYASSEWRSSDRYSYSEVEHLFEAVRKRFAGTQCGYRIFGHSAGAQFVHRLLTFRPDARAEAAVSANAGWYTLPDGFGTSNRNYFMPYGLQGSPVRESDLDRTLGRRLTVLGGSLDTVVDGDLRTTTEANYQGDNRLERSRFYYDTGYDQSIVSSTPFAWLYDVVAGAGHDRTQVSGSAGWYLFESDGEPGCTATRSADAKLVINEVHADPASSTSSGDANADGIRDSSDDEFVEIVNVGASTVCLSGWYLGDASDKARHRFASGSELDPGDAIVVFGGGVPTGTFGGSRVQWAMNDSLSLSNAGDVLKLRDAASTTEASLSWGDCGGASCVADHYGGTLEIDQALTRSPDETGTWKKHTSVSSKRWTPGRTVSGGSF